MKDPLSLDGYLAGWAADDAARGAIGRIVSELAQAGGAISHLIGLGPLAGRMGEVVGSNSDQDAQKALDVLAEDYVLAALRRAPVAVLGSEETEEPVLLNAGAPFAVAIDPLDGSSNIDTNVSIGTIFSILPVAADPKDSFFQPGSLQHAGGFFIYGPSTALAITLGDGSHVFTLDRGRQEFFLTGENIQIPLAKHEYAINASNYRFWNDPVRAYVDDCIAGADGPLASDSNMRWIASMVAEAFRILGRGGVFLYPSDGRKGYSKGRLRLVYEANPIAFLMEQAGGMATDGQTRILDIIPESLHERTPLVFGSRDRVELLSRYHSDPSAIADRSPLFGRRGLLRV